MASVVILDYSAVLHRKRGFGNKLEVAEKCDEQVYRVGETIALQRQSELINAKLREIRATTDRSEAEADVDRSTANTLNRIVAICEGHGEKENR